MIPVIHKQVAPLPLPPRSILVPQFEYPVSVGRILPNHGHRSVVADDRLVVGSPRKALCHAKTTAGVVNCHLERDRRKSLFALVGGGEVERAHAPADVGNICRPDRPRKAQLIILLHSFVLVLSGREVDIYARRTAPSRNAGRTRGTL